MTPPRRGSEPVPVRDALTALGRDLGIPDPTVMGALHQHWAELVGEAIAMHAMPQSLRDGVLTIAADSPGWAGQLRYLERDLVARSGAVVGEGVVEVLRVVVADRPRDP